MAHFFSTTTPVCNKHPTADPIAIHTPSGAILHSTHEADLDIPGLPAAACHGHIVPTLATQPLLSIGQLCDASCHIAFMASMVTISHDNAVTLQGTHTLASRIWELNICPQTPHHANTALASANVADLVAFAHAALFSPALSTLEEALRHQHVPKFAGLSLQSLQQYPHSPMPPSKDTWIRCTRTSDPPSYLHPLTWPPRYLTPTLFLPPSTMATKHTFVMLP